MSYLYDLLPKRTAYVIVKSYPASDWVVTGHCESCDRDIEERKEAPPEYNVWSARVVQEDEYHAICHDPFEVQFGCHWEERRCPVTAIELEHLYDTKEEAEEAITKGIKAWNEENEED